MHSSLITLGQFGGSIIANRHGYEKWNPLNNIAQWSTPELVIHSSKDYRLPISEALSAFNILQVQGVDSEFLMFPDENHWVLKPENSLVGFLSLQPSFTFHS